MIRNAAGEMIVVGIICSEPFVLAGVIDHDRFLIIRPDST
jgi:hypothetical protein